MKKIPLKERSLSGIALKAAVGLLLALTLFGFLTINTRGLDSGAAAGKLVGDLWNMFSTPSSEHFGAIEALWALLVTFCLGFLTTLIGAALALVVGLFGARNLSPRWLVTIIKTFVAFIRAVPTVLWVLIFSVGAGLGSVSAVVGMSFHSFSYLVKAYSESFETLDSDVIEALKASGANWLQIVTQAVIPSSMGQLVSWTFLRFEINFTNAIAMGAAAGAGGIGYELFMASGFYFNLHEVGLITWLILAVAIGLEIGATRLKRAKMTVR
jgi:phosphonate transport system permease protein